MTRPCTCCYISRSFHFRIPFIPRTHISDRDSDHHQRHNCCLPLLVLWQVWEDRKENFCYLSCVVYQYCGWLVPGRNSFKNRTNIKKHQQEKKHFNPLPLMFSPLQLFQLQNETVILQVPCSTSSGYFLTPEITQLLQSLLVSVCIKGWLLLWVQRRSERIQRKRQMMCQRYGIKGSLHSHILPSPWEYTLNYTSLKAFFPMGIYTKLQIFESSFPINYVNIFLPNSGGTKKILFSHFSCTGVLSCNCSLNPYRPLYTSEISTQLYLQRSQTA